MPASVVRSIEFRVARFYFFLPDPNVGCHPAAGPLWLGAAAIVLIFSFLGFFFSRLLLCSPFAMSSSSGWAVQKLFRDRLFRNLPAFAVEDRDVERLHRRVVVRRVAVIDIVKEKRRVEASQHRGLLQDIWELFC